MIAKYYFRNDVIFKYSNNKPLAPTKKDRLRESKKFPVGDIDDITSILIDEIRTIKKWHIAYAARYVKGYNSKYQYEYNISISIYSHPESIISLLMPSIVITIDDTVVSLRSHDDNEEYNAVYNIMSYDNDISKFINHVERQVKFKLIKRLIKNTLIVFVSVILLSAIAMAVIYSSS